MLNPNTEPQKVEATTTEAQPPKPKRPYEPPKAEVISFENDYVRADMSMGMRAGGPSYEGSYGDYRHTGDSSCPMCHGQFCAK